jgi:carboxyl-terminal processing protease
VAPGPEFRTDLGRKVYGGGGITPDVLAEPAEVATLFQFLLSRNAFFNFAVEYNNRHQIKDREWQPRPELLDEFRAWLIAEKLGAPEELQEAFAEPAARDYALTRIHAEVLNSAFGQEAWHRVLAKSDQQIASALSKFEQAHELLVRRQALDAADGKQEVAAVEDESSPSL